MKKIVLFSLIACLGFVDNSFAEQARDCDNSKSCGRYPIEGDVEQKMCLKDGNETEFDKRWKKANSDCGDSRATIAKCIRQKNKASEDVMSCAAKICKEGFALWLEGNSSYGRCRTGEEILSMSRCDCRHCGKDERCVPHIFEWRNGTFGITKAFNGEKPCVCVKQGGESGGDEKDDKPVTPIIPSSGDCVFDDEMTITCKNGEEHTSKLEGLFVNKQDIEDPKQCSAFKEKLKRCFEFERDEDCDDKANANFAEILKKVKKQKQELSKRCDTVTSVSLGDVVAVTINREDFAIRNAQKVLDDFYAWAKDDDNRSVWKDSEGKFNTTRLASDLTAGVVLGTVGGVVSGVVIKKKQVEKGFDALHCTVGGQTVADWGDTFNVGLR